MLRSILLSIVTAAAAVVGVASCSAGAPADREREREPLRTTSSAIATLQGGPNLPTLHGGPNLLWQNTQTGEIAPWLLSGTSVTQGPALSKAWGPSAALAARSDRWCATRVRSATRAFRRTARTARAEGTEPRAAPTASVRMAANVRRGSFAGAIDAACRSFHPRAAVLSRRRTPRITRSGSATPRAAPFRVFSFLRTRSKRPSVAPIGSIAVPIR